MKQHLLHSAQFSFLVAIAAVVMTAILFWTLEPAVTRSQISSNEFTIKQVVGDEISFLVQPSNITMNGDAALDTINGLTGGHGTGSTPVVVRTNSATGYTMTISFENNDPAMRGENTGSQSLRDLGVTSQPNYNFTASTSAIFGYTVNASTTGDIDESFMNNGASCNVGTTESDNKCWYSATSSPFQIVNRNTSATDGATTTIKFKIYVPNNPVPSLDSDTYTATATLTATNQ